LAPREGHSSKAQTVRDKNGQYFIRWCFADKGIAEAFAQKFGVR
jgi:hypothetical protein